jgi:Ca-activated chloride channel family protein
MSFVHPAVLLLLALVPFAALGLARAERSRRRALEEFGDPELLARSSALADPGIRRRRNRLRIAALALLLVALARPQLGERPSQAPHTGRDLLVLLDLSRSMSSPDVEPNRLAGAKEAVRQLAAALPGDRVGLIVFGGSPFLLLPLTQDRATLQLFLDHARTEYLYDPSTDIASALLSALTVYQHEGSRGSRAIILVSDGEAPDRRLPDVTSKLRLEGIPVFVLGVGSKEGGPVPADTAEAPERWHRDHIGRVVHSRLEERVLIQIAEQTGGAYLHWESGTGVAGLMSRINEVGTRTLSSAGTTERADRFQWPLGVAVLLLLLELGLSPRPGTRAPFHSNPAAVLLVLVLGLGPVACTTAEREARRGQRFYDASNWSESYAAFQRAIDAGSSPALEYNAGNALFRLRHFEDAVKRFRAVPSDSSLLYRAALFNLGSAYIRAAEELDEGEKGEPLQLAVSAFEEVLQFDPADGDAKWNLELALRRLGDLPEGGSPGRDRRSDYGRGQMNDPNREGTEEAAVGAMAGGGYGSASGESAEELTEEQARRLLESVMREQLRTHEGRQAGRGKPPGKDW